MSGETESQVSGWTTDTLRYHYDRRLEDLDKRLDERFEAQETAVQFALTEREKAVNAALTAAKEAVNKAENATEKRFESVNEFRAQLTDQTSTFMPREVVEPRLAAVEKWQAKIIGALAFITVVLPVVVAFAVYLLTRHAIPAVPTTTTP